MVRHWREKGSKSKGRITIDEGYEDLNLLFLQGRITILAFSKGMVRHWREKGSKSAVFTKGRITILAFSKGMVRHWREGI